MWYIGTSLIHFDELLVVGILEKSQPIVGYHYHKKVTSLFHEDNLGPIQITWSFSTNQRPVSRSRDHPRPIREQHLWSLDHYFPKIILDSFLVSFSPPPLESLLSDSLEMAPVSSLWRTWSWAGVNTLQCRENSLNIIDSSSSWWGNVKKETTFTSSSYSLVHIGTFFCSKRIFLPLAKNCPLPGSGWRCLPPSPRAAHSASPCAAQCPAAESSPESSSSSSSSCPAAGVHLNQVYPLRGELHLRQVLCLHCLVPLVAGAPEDSISSVSANERSVLYQCQPMRGQCQLSLGLDQSESSIYLMIRSLLLVSRMSAAYMSRSSTTAERLLLRRTSWNKIYSY